MKRLVILALAVVMVLSFTACGQEPVIVEQEPTQVQEEEQKVEPDLGWKYDESTKTLRVYELMDSFESNEQGSTTAPWSEFSSEVENIIVDENIGWIGEYAFAFCSNLKTVEVKSAVEHISYRAFYMCGDYNNQGNLDMTFKGEPGFDEEAFGVTINNPNATVDIIDGDKHYWGRYLLPYAMHIKDYVYQPESVDELIDLTLHRVRYLSYENADGAYKHGGGQLSKGNVKKDYPEDKITLISGSKPAKVSLQTKLRFFGEDQAAQQAIVIKFQPESATDLSFTFKDKTEISFSFEGDDIYFNDIDNDTKIAFSEFIPNDFELVSDKAYQLYFAFDDMANMRILVWEDGNFGNSASFETSLYQGDDKIYDSNWEMTIRFGAEQQFSVYEYAVYTFESFIRPPITDETGEQEGNNIQSKDDVLYSMLMNPQELWSEGSTGFADNQGGEFGGGVKMGYNPDMQRLEIFGEDTGACAQFNTSLMTCMSDVGMDKVPQQAVLVKFSASDITKDVRVSFEALDEITFSFRDDGIYFVDVANFFEMPISDFMPNNLELKNDTIYYYFFSFDAEGNIRMFIWEDGLEENQAYFEYDLYQESADINSCDLMMYLAVSSGEQFNIYEYWVYTFDNFIDNPLG